MLREREIDEARHRPYIASRDVTATIYESLAMHNARMRKLARPPARIVLMSDGKETVPSNPNNPKGAYTAARTAKDQGVPISTVSFGTPYGYVEINGQRQPVPVDDEMLKKIAELSGGHAYTRRAWNSSRRSSPLCRSRSATRP